MKESGKSRCRKEELGPGHLVGANDYIEPGVVTEQRWREREWERGRGNKTKTTRATCVQHGEKRQSGVDMLFIIAETDIPRSIGRPNDDSNFSALW